VTLASNLYLAELVNREHAGARKAWFSARALAAGLSGGFLPEPRSADVVVRAHTSSTPLARIGVDTHDAADVLRKVQDDLDRLDVVTFKQQWGVR
jgi:hypothetical protein